MSKSKKHFETKAIRTQLDKARREHSVPLYLTSSFVFDDAEQARALFADEVEGNIYSRFTNPNLMEFEDKMCLLEGAEDGFATASGMAAVFASFAALLKAGDHIVASRALFGAIHQILTNILPKWNITHTYVDEDTAEQWEAAIRPETKMIFVETPSNPGLKLIDLSALSKLAKKHNILLNVDNCLATPYLQQPISYGADLVIHSATKFLDGQGRVLGGVVVGRKDLIDEIRGFCRKTGPALSPFNAWVLSKSLETLAVRMEKHCQHAHHLANWLEQHPEIEQVIYPFLKSHPQHKLAEKQMKLGGGIVTFIVKGGYQRVKKFLDSLDYQLYI
ncbi:MAG: aminotransferase class I/II-fold pyridoxal phosphate-dependent enzyme [Bacteroidetes bacterium]|nr:aminotransferase class I/II-fold pyridoxal phosphate-dependent enzyme [Bacteroidota bacterium]